MTISFQMFLGDRSKINGNDLLAQLPIRVENLLYSERKLSFAGKTRPGSALSFFHLVVVTAMATQSLWRVERGHLMRFSSFGVKSLEPIVSNAFTSSLPAVLNMPFAIMLCTPVCPPFWSLGLVALIFFLQTSQAITTGVAMSRTETIRIVALPVLWFFYSVMISGT